jgi:hypothetical protein
MAEIRDRFLAGVDLIQFAKGPMMMLAGIAGETRKAAGGIRRSDSIALNVLPFAFDAMTRP